MILVIDGPINSGKSTISKLLLDEIDDSVHIEIDDLRNFAPNLTLDQVIPYALEDSLDLTRKWVLRGYHVILSWPISKENYEHFVNLSQELTTPLYGFTLFPSIEMCLSDRGDRLLTQWEKDRIKELYKTLYKNNPIGIKIDTAILSKKECVQYILSIISNY